MNCAASTPALLSKANLTTHQNVAHRGGRRVRERGVARPRVLPAIGGLDLRPYLFVTKDKKDFFGPISALGHLAAVADKLFGPKLTVQGYLDELRQLKAAEADKVFEAVRSRIIGAAVFDTLPDGIHGLRALVQAQPLLQGRLIDFLESLPKSRCGAWVVSGWQGVIVEANCTTRLDALLGEWSKAGGNAALKAAALGSRRLKIVNAFVFRSAGASRSGCRQLRISLNSSGVRSLLIVSREG